MGVSLECGDTGFDLRSFPASTWLIHAMYEKDMDSPISHDDLEKRQIALGLIAPSAIDGVDLSAVTTSTGVALGWTKAPPAPYRRIRWRDYATRNSLPILVEGQWPGHRGFRPGDAGDNWRENVVPPAEGSIDEESWLELVSVLVAHSRLGASTRCTAFYTPWTLSPDRSPFLMSGALGNAGALLQNPASIGSPQNFWPDGLDWFVYTDYDLQASRISGSVELIEALLRNANLDCQNLGGVAS